jgi:hypothetical protein
VPGVAQSCRKGDFARETLSVPVEPHAATLVTSYHGLHRMSAKTLARRWIERRSARLSPVEHEPAICSARLLNANLTFPGYGPPPALS